MTGGVPTLSLNDLGTAVYDAVHSTSAALVFKYTVATGEDVSYLVVTAIHLNGATVRDAGLANADLSGAVANPAGTLQIDTTGPRPNLAPPYSTHFAPSGCEYPRRRS